MSDYEENPFLRAQKVESDRAADLIGRVKLWQAIALMALMIALAGVGGVIYFASQSQFVPYVVEVDKLGEALAVRPADRAARVDERVVKHLLAAWIADLREVSFDRQVQNENVWRVYSSLRAQDPATNKITAYMRDENTSPVARSGAEVVSPEIISVLPEGDKSWQVDWYETTFDRASGKQLSKKRWRALLSVYFLPPSSKTTEAEIQRNPLGLYVRDFSWAEQQ